MKVTNDKQEQQVLLCQYAADHDNVHATKRKAYTMPNHVKKETKHIGSRIIWIDMAKAICIILVVIGHYFPDIHPEWYGTIRSVIYSFHMPLFMFASGFVYIATYQDSGYIAFLTKKAKRLMIPYFTTSILVISFKLCTQGNAYVENPVTLMSYLKIIYQPEAGAFLWFIWALWWMFVIIPFFNTRILRLVLFIIAFFIPLAIPYLPEIFCLHKFAGMLLYFIAGIMVYDWRELLIWVKHIPLIAVFTVFCIVEMIPPVYWGGKYIVAFIGIAFILKSSFVISNNVNRKTKFLVVSSASYIIYLLHTTFEGLAKAVIVKLPYLSDLSNGVMFTIGAVIVISAGLFIPIWINNNILKRYRITRVLFGLKEGVS